MKIFLVAFLLLASSTFAAKWDQEYWHFFQISNLEKEKFKLYTNSEVRFNHHIKKPYYYLIGENFSFKACDFLNLEAHYSYIYQKPRGSTRFFNSHRFEFEINPSYKFSNGVLLKWRNRLELIKQQHISKMLSDIRHRLTVEIPLRYKILKAFIMSNEVFYDLNNHYFDENRFIPAELAFDLTKKSTFHLFFMIRHFYSANLWYRSFVLGSQIKF